MLPKPTSDLFDPEIFSTVTGPISTMIYPINQQEISKRKNVVCFLSLHLNKLTFTLRLLPFTFHPLFTLVFTCYSLSQQLFLQIGQAKYGHFCLQYWLPPLQYCLNYEFLWLISWYCFKFSVFDNAIGCGNYQRYHLHITVLIFVVVFCHSQS